MLSVEKHKETYLFTSCQQIVYITLSSILVAKVLSHDPPPPLPTPHPHNLAAFTQESITLKTCIDKILANVTFIVIKPFL